MAVLLPRGAFLTEDRPIFTQETAEPLGVSPPKAVDSFLIENTINGHFLSRNSSLVGCRACARASVTLMTEAKAYPACSRGCHATSCSTPTMRRKVIPQGRGRRSEAPTTPPQPRVSTECSAYSQATLSTVSRA